MLDLTGLDNLAAASVNKKTTASHSNCRSRKSWKILTSRDNSFPKNLCTVWLFRLKLKEFKTPISVKPVTGGDKYVINHGARRYRASILAGFAYDPGLYRRDAR